MTAPRDIIRANRVPPTFADRALAALREAAGGGPLVLQWKPTPCAACDGDGELWVDGDLIAPCPTCDGSGGDVTVTMHGLDLVGYAAHVGGVPEILPLYRRVDIAPAASTPTEPEGEQP